MTGGSKKKRPDWLKISLPFDTSHHKMSDRVKDQIREVELKTVCEEASCPNRNRCWSSGTATFLILGERCTRNCRFCNIQPGKPNPPDPNEPNNTAIAVRALNLKHAVITSVTRDDLVDGGSGQYVKVIHAVKKMNPNTTIEVLIPDFKADQNLIDAVLDSGPDIVNHNVETVPSLYSLVCPQSSYKNSLSVLEYASSRGFLTKSGLLIGLGEKLEEVHELLKNLVNCGVQMVTIGQYLQPSSDNIPVSNYIEPLVFENLKNYALSLGFLSVESAPFVRSSYHAEKSLFHTKK